MFCRKCGIKESTGFIVILCDVCFDEFEKLNPEKGQEIIEQYLATKEELDTNYAEFTQENPSERN